MVRSAAETSPDCGLQSGRRDRPRVRGAAQATPLPTAQKRAPSPVQEAATWSRKGWLSKRKIRALRSRCSMAYWAGCTPAGPQSQGVNLPRTSLFAWVQACRPCPAHRPLEQRNCNLCEAPDHTRGAQRARGPGHCTEFARKRCVRAILICEPFSYASHFHMRCGHRWRQSWSRGRCQQPRAACGTGVCASTCLERKQEWLCCGVRVSENCLARPRETRRRNSSLVPMPQTPPRGFRRAVRRERPGAVSITESTHPAAGSRRG